MKYSHRSNYRKTCPHDPETRAQLGLRLQYARKRLGWSIEDAGKYFQVTDRTWHNWENGSHRIPYAVYKLLRVLARLELPGKAWAGWHLEGDVLITPEGRQITPQDGSWWSLLVRRAAGFGAAYNEAATLRKLLMQVKSTATGTASACGEAAALPAPDAVGLVPYKTTLDSVQVVESKHNPNNVIMTSWPILYDFPTPSTSLHAVKPNTSESASTHLSALPWTPTCEIRVNLLRPDQGSPSPKWGTGKTLVPKRETQRQSSPEPKSRPSTKKRNENARQTSNPDSSSAMPAAAKAGMQEIGPRGES